MKQIKPKQTDDPKELSASQLGWAAFHLKGKFFKYLFHEKDIPKNKRTEAELQWFFYRHIHYHDQRKKDGPWLTLVKDIKQSFVVFWTNIRKQYTS